MVEVITSWKTLFQLAAKSGKAKMAWLKTPTEENKAAYDAAVKEHDDYRDVCLKADRMIHLAGVFDPTCRSGLEQR